MPAAERQGKPGTGRRDALFHELFEASAWLDPEKTAVDIDGVKATFGEMVQAQQQLSRALKDAKALPGDRVALSCAISPAAIASALGVMQAGCILATISHSCEAEAFFEQLADCGATVLITDRSVDPRTLAMRTVVQQVQHISSGALAPRPLGSPMQLQGKDPFSAQPERVDRAAAIFYSSGSTGKPKGILVSHRNMTAAFRSVTGYLGTSRSDRVLSFTAGLSSDYGFYNIMMPLLLGASAVVRSTLPARGQDICAILRREKISALQVFPPAILRMLEAETLLALPALRYISSSGDVLPPRHIGMLRDAYPHVRFFSNYGMTECKRIAYLAPEQLERRPGSVGKAIPGVRTFLFDEHGVPIHEPSRIGELGVTGDLVMRGYWNQPELTATVLKRNFADGQSLFLTGDLFQMDEEGYLSFVCRKQDVFVRDGEKINPRNIERELLSHPHVAEVVVLPVRSGSPGFVPCACIVRRSGSNVSARELGELCEGRLRLCEVPERFVFLESLPRTFGGKASRRGLVENAHLIGIFRGEQT